MEYVNLGHSGLKVSRICLGTLTFGSPKWRSYILDETESRPIIQRALELGSISWTRPTCIPSASVKRSSVGR
jgi:aryl-alcohol dehydrogenase-like predicted oxidoreductase